MSVRKMAIELIKHCGTNPASAPIERLDVSSFSRHAGYLTAVHYEDGHPNYPDIRLVNLGTPLSEMN